MTLVCTDNAFSPLCVCFAVTYVDQERNRNCDRQCGNGYSFIRVWTAKDTYVASATCTSGVSPVFQS